MHARGARLIYRTRETKFPKRETKIQKNTKIVKNRAGSQILFFKVARLRHGSKQRPCAPQRSSETMHARGARLIDRTRETKFPKRRVRARRYAKKYKKIWCSKVFPKYSPNVPKMLPKCCTNDPQMVPNWCPHGPQIFPNCLPNGTQKGTQMLS